MNGRLLALTLACVALPEISAAQPTDIPVPAAKTVEFPANVRTAKVGEWQVYTDAQGRTLYGMDMRTVARWSIDTSKYCAERCSEWEPLLAPPGTKPNLTTFRGFRGAGGRAGGPASPPPAGAPASGQPSGAAGAAAATPNQQQQLSAFFGFGGAPTGMYTQANAPDWTVVDGPAGPQWVYKGYNMVYVRKGDRPRSAAYEGADERTWNTLKFIPPVPTLTAPGGVGSVFSKDGYGYLLTNKDGNLLYTGRCSSPCTDWKPLPAGIASQGIGEWSVDRSGDRPQWLYRGKPVYVSRDAEIASLPRSTVALRP